MSRIGQLISRALNDRQVTKAETDGLIRQAQADGNLSSSEKRELSRMLRTHADKFEPAAKTSLATFLGEPAPAPARPSAPTPPAAPAVPAHPLSPDPAVLAKHAGTTFSRVDGGQLFVGGISYDDVLQGSMGNCYFVGSLSAVAHASPRTIEDAIRSNGDGTYTVRLYKEGSDGRFKAEYVRVDDDLPGGGTRYGKSRDGKELWVGLVEKAYASWKGGYEAIGNGGYSTEVMSALTGRRSVYYSTKNNAAEVMFNTIRRATTHNVAITAGTFGKDSGVDYAGTGVYANHNYTILSASEENGVKYVQLRNPWGQSEPGNDGKNDGIFKMKLDDFARLYQGVNVNS